jgi:hypothetical protein
MGRYLDLVRQKGGLLSQEENSGKQEDNTLQSHMSLLSHPRTEADEKFPSSSLEGDKSDKSDKSPKSRRNPREADATKAPGFCDKRVVECCECGLPITERLETWWGGERAHRSCGEAAFERAKSRGSYSNKGLA